MRYHVLIASPLVALAAIILIVAGCWRRRPIGSTLTNLVTLAYLTAVASVTLFPIDTDAFFIQQMRLHNGWLDGVNLVPFAALMRGGADARDSATQLGLNLAMGVPFGFLLPFLGCRRLVRVLAKALAFALVIEGVQLGMDFAYGFGYRTVDVDDVMANWLGAIAGYGCFRLLATIYRRWEFSEADMGPWLHRVMTASW